MIPKPDDRTIVDPRVADAWREATGEEPSASVDAAILAAARREVSAKPEHVDLGEVREARASRRRWWPLAAAATIAAVAVGVLQVTPTDKLGAPAADTAIVSDVPAPAAKPSPEIAPPPSPSKEEKPSRTDDARGGSESKRAEEPRRAAPSAAPPAARPVAPSEPRQQKSVEPAPAAAAAAEPYSAPPELAAQPFPGAPSGKVSATPSPPPAAPAANASRERDAQRREPAAPAPVTEPADSRAAERGASAPAPLAKMAAGRAADRGVDEARAKDRSPLPVPEWIALIRRLRAEGKQAEAAKEIAAFRAAHADHEKLLPPDLRDWRPVDK